MAVHSKEFTLLNTRPTPKGQVLTAKIQALDLTHKINVIDCPTLEIEFLPVSTSLLESPPPDKLIFISVNAVQGFMALNPSQNTLNWIKKTPTYAIGKATAKALQAQGFNCVTLSQSQFDTEHFLQQPDMQAQAIRGQTLALIKGKNGRPLLAETLKQRGAKVVEYAVYQRQPLPINAQAWLNFTRAKKPVILLTSVESYQALKQALKQLFSCQTEVNTRLFKYGLDGLQHQTAIVFSPRIQRVLQADGWQGAIYCVPIQSDSGIIEVLNSL